MKIVTITIDELKEIIQETVRNVLQGITSTQAKPDDDLIKRTDVARLFKVSLVTLHEWMRKGRIPFYRISSRIFFKKSEVMNALAAGKPVKNEGK